MERSSDQGTPGTTRVSISPDSSSISSSIESKSRPDNTDTKVQYGNNKVTSRPLVRVTTLRLLSIRDDLDSGPPWCVSVRYFFLVLNILRPTVWCYFGPSLFGEEEESHTEVMGDDCLEL